MFKKNTDRNRLPTNRIDMVLSTSDILNLDINTHIYLELFDGNAYLI